MKPPFSASCGRHVALASLLAHLLHCPSTWGQEAAAIELAPVEVEGTRENEDVREPGRPGTLLRGGALRDRRGATLGETVGEEAGVHNASFGSGVGLPVIRGLSGARVKVLSNGGATHDASTFSPDHASTADATLAESVRVLRGPATVRYGGGAIGGVVDVEDGRIPLRVPLRGVEGVFDTSYNFNGAERVGAVRLDAGRQEFVLRGSASSRNRGDSHIAGCAVDDAAVLQQFGQINTENSCGRLRNSDARSAAGTLGGSLFIGNVLLGAAVNNGSNNYGIPPAPGHSHGGENRVRIDMDNRRVDTRAEWVGESWLEGIRYTGSHIEYRHDEIDNGTVATTFRNDAIEQRLELAHRAHENLPGTIGVHHVQRRFSAVGVESFVPRTELRSSALYAVQQFRWSAWTLEAGWRTDLVRMQAEPRLGVPFPARRMAPQSRSLALHWQASDELKLSITRSISQRAPEIHELYSLGPHLATRTYEIGRPDLAIETMRGLELGIELDTARVGARLNLFSNEADNYIYQQTLPGFYNTARAAAGLFPFQGNCVRLEECLPLVQHTQSDARLKGFEAEVSYKWRATPAGDLDGSVFVDRVDGRLAALNQDLPRMPPLRYGVQIAFRKSAWDGRLRVTRYADQDRPGINETPSDGYTRVDANLNHLTRLTGDSEMTVFLRVRNLLDAEIRNATSFLRSFSPEPGRSVEVGMTISF
ncbi:TonB-dependent receptor [Methyloversatilis discipulorum]|uniref:TonB-dependent receptor n=1 Tax=Methyloversatilis discipulorum TaxID=1119528 RepID=UPI001E39AD0B|nr:TonB-dependent receptor [Methyloversatilis discipulorum]